MIANGMRTGLGDEWIRLGATAEQFSDGSFSERTMSRSTPYPGRTPPYYGNLTQTQEGLDALVEKQMRAGIEAFFADRRKTPEEVTAKIRRARPETAEPSTLEMALALLAPSV